MQKSKVDSQPAKMDASTDIFAVLKTGETHV